MLSLKIYQFITILMLGGAIMNSFQKYEQYYPVLIDLIEQKINYLILINFLLMIYLTIQLNYNLFIFGQFTEGEKMFVIDRLKRKVIELVFLVIIFRESYNFSTFFFVMFVALIALQVNHWFINRRVNSVINQAGQINYIRIMKLMICFINLFIVDILVFVYIKESGSRILNNAFIPYLFLVEIFKSFIMTFNYFLKFWVFLSEIFTLQHIENRQMIFSIMDLVSQVLRIGTRCYFMMYLQKLIGLQINLIFDIIVDFIVLIRIIRNFRKAFKLVKQLKQLENATPEQIQNTDTICLICQDDMDTGKIINCGHIFHQQCLSMWIQKAVNQICPKCKRQINLDELVNQIQQKKNQIDINVKLEQLRLESMDNKIILVGKQNQGIIQVLEQKQLKEQFNVQNFLNKNESIRFNDSKLQQYIKAMSSFLKKIDTNFYGITILQQDFDSVESILHSQKQIGSLPYGLAQEIQYSYSRQVYENRLNLQNFYKLYKVLKSNSHLAKLLFNEYKIFTESD